MEEGNVAMGFDPPPVGRIKRATEQEEGVEDVSKPLHKSARMIMPKPNPSNSFSRKTLLRITGGMIGQSRPMSRKGMTRKRLFPAHSFHRLVS
jgi:hypothetical protein